jgi:hypothetical protein
MNTQEREIFHIPAAWALAKGQISFLANVLISG